MKAFKEVGQRVRCIITESLHYDRPGVVTEIRKSGYAMVALEAIGRLAPVTMLGQPHEFAKVNKIDEKRWERHRRYAEKRASKAVRL